MILYLKNLKKYFVSKHYDLKNLISLLFGNFILHRLLFLVFILVVSYIFTLDNVAFASEIDPEDIINETQKEYKFYKDWKFWGAIAGVVTVGILAIVFFSGSDDDDGSSSSIDTIAKLDTTTIETAKAVDTTDVITRVVEVVPPDLVSAVSSVDVVAAVTATAAVVKVFTHQDAVALLDEFNRNIEVTDFKDNYIDKTFSFLFDNIEISRNIFASNYKEYKFLKESRLGYNLSWLADSIFRGLFLTYPSFTEDIKQASIVHQYEFTYFKISFVEVIVCYLKEIIAGFSKILSTGAVSTLQEADISNPNTFLDKPYQYFLETFKSLREPRLFWFFRNVLLPEYFSHLEGLRQIIYNFLIDIPGERLDTQYLTHLVNSELKNWGHSLDMLIVNLGAGQGEITYKTAVGTFFTCYSKDASQIDGNFEIKMQYFRFKVKMDIIVDKLIKFFKS